ncbi:MAG TPA: YfhO family protein [Clostridiaceae bacterium]|nr:YfhO family protein [Clostridiaceae bacterium]
MFLKLRNNEIVTNENTLKSKNKINDKNFRKSQHLLSFLCPLIIMFICFICIGLSPFGNNNLMAMDAYAQYYPMLRQAMRPNIFVKSDWSFTGALGYNQLTQSTYYTNSPLWLILHLIPEKYSITGIHFIVLLRFGLAGLTFSYFIKQYFAKLSRYTFIFATAYALSSYTLAFINQFMWLDIVILLPLVAAALVRLWLKGHFLLYVISLALALYTNFYLAYTLCLFACLWSLYLMFKEKVSWTERFSYFIKFIFASILAAGLTAFSLIPTYLALQKTIASDLGHPQKIKFYHSLRDYLQKLLPFQKISLAYEAANIYFGLSNVVLIILFHLSNKKKRKSILLISVILFAYLSFNCNIFDYVWHGLHFPNQLPARQSYLFIFVMLLFAYRAFTKNTLFFQRKRQQKILWLKNIFAIILLTELFLNALYTLHNYTWKANHETYIKYEKGMQYLVEKYAPQNNEFYRMEFIFPQHNQGLRYGYNGIGYYSSLMSKSCYDFFQNIGMEVYAENVSVNYVPNKYLNNLFSIRYLIQKEDEPVPVEHLNLRKIESYDKLTLYENPNYLPLVFAIEDVDRMNTQAKDLRKFLLTVKDLPEYPTTAKFNLCKEKSIIPLQITHFTPDRIKGEMILSEDAQLLTGIAAEAGWEIRVDNKSITPFTAFDYLLAAPLKTGKHSIELIYHTPGKNLGIGIMIISICCLSIWLYVDNCRRKKYIINRNPGTIK